MPRFVFGPADEKILRAITVYHYLTAEQVRRLYYGRSISHVQERLKGLADDHFLARRYLRRPARLGSEPTIYTLDRKGWQFVRDELGLEVAPRLRTSEAPGDYLFYQHILNVNDVLIAAELLPRTVPQVVLEDLRHDLTLQRAPVRLTLPNQVATKLAPDGWLSFLVEMADGRFRVPVALEVDRGTEGRAKWQEKMRTYLAGYGQGKGKGPLLTAFGVSTLTVAITTPTPERRGELMAWTAALLAETRQEGKAALFRFTHADPVTLGPEAFYLAPHWSRLDDQAPVALLVPKGAA